MSVIAHPSIGIRERRVVQELRVRKRLHERHQGRAVRSVELVPLAELAAHLPEGTRFVTPEERADQQRARAESYARRLR